MKITKNQIRFLSSKKIKKKLEEKKSEFFLSAMGPWPVDLFPDFKSFHARNIHQID